MVEASQLDTYYKNIRSALVSGQSAFRSRLNVFYSMLQARLDISKAAHQRIAVFNAPDFTPFAYVSLDENAVSRIVADLLNAAGPHGQGELFLREFLKLIEID